MQKSIPIISNHEHLHTRDLIHPLQILLTRSLASGLASAADSSVGSVNAFKQGDVASSIGLGATAVSEAGGAATTDGTSANAAASNVSGTETTTVVGADGVEKEAAVVTDPATGQEVATTNEVQTGVTLVA